MGSIIARNVRETCWSCSSSQSLFKLLVGPSNCLKCSSQALPWVASAQLSSGRPPPLVRLHLALPLTRVRLSAQSLQKACPGIYPEVITGRQAQQWLSCKHTPRDSAQSRIEDHPCQAAMDMEPPKSAVAEARSRPGRVPCYDTSFAPERLSPSTRERIPLTQFSTKKRHCAFIQGSFTTAGNNGSMMAPDDGT